MLLLENTDYFLSAFLEVLKTPRCSGYVWLYGSDQRLFRGPGLRQGKALKLCIRVQGA